jgi:HAD superfamily hydrolase (TIGR01549 family)
MLTDDAHRAAFPASVDLVLLDLDETLLATSALETVRHSHQPLPLAEAPGFSALVLHAGILDLLTALDHRISVGLVTSSPRWYVEQILAASLPRVAFDVVVTFDDVVRLKPDPEPLQIALDRTGVVADRALYVGDDLYDHEACRAAGVKFFGAAWADRPTFPSCARSLAHPLALLDYLRTPAAS